MAIMSYRGLLSSIVEPEGHGHWTQGQAERTPVSTDLWLHHHRGSGCVHVPTPVLCLCSPFLCYGVHLCACSWHMHTDPPWLPTRRLTAESIDRCVPVRLSRWSCFRLLCFLYIVLCGTHSVCVVNIRLWVDMGHIEYMTGLCAGLLWDQVPTLLPATILCCWTQPRAALLI